MSSPSYIKPSTRLRQLLAQPNHLIIAPGAYDGISAHIALSTFGDGIGAVYMTGAGTTASRLGLPDLAFASQDDFVANATMIAGVASAKGVPVIADADTGFGGSAQIARTVQRYDRGGVAALHIEDQVIMKRCGHLLGKQLVTEDEFVQRIRAAAEGRRTVPGGSDIVIIARSDAVQANGIEDAIHRLKAAVSAGADVAFVEGLESTEQLKRAVKELAPTPVLLNIVPGGVTPDWSINEIREMGVKIVIYPALPLNAVLDCFRDTYKTLKDTGRPPKTETRVKDFFLAVGLEEALRVDQVAGGAAYQGGV